MSNNEGLIIDALHAPSWNGIVMADGRDAVFAFRIVVQARETVDGEHIYNAIREVGPHAPDCSYCRLEWLVEPSFSLATAILEWSQDSDTSVVGSLTLCNTQEPAELLVIGFSPWDYTVHYSVQDNTLEGRSGGKIFALATDPALVSRGEEPMALRLSLEPGIPVCFSATMGRVSSRDSRDILRRLADAQAKYLVSRVEVEGSLARTGESITNNINWLRHLIPHTPISYVPAGRTWAWADWTIFEWDGFFNAALASVENKPLAESMVQALVWSQLENGNMANFVSNTSDKTSADRSQPQVGSYCCWKIYERFGRDRNWLARVYPALVKWHNWWLADGGTGRPRRDGNNDGLLEWGSDNGNMQQAMWESGMDDCPLWDEAEFVDETWTMNMNALDCSCLYTLDCLCLAKMAHELGESGDEERFKAEYDKMKSLINDKLWNEEAGMYLDRYWDGRFSTHVSVSNFYPLIAGIASSERAERMMKAFNDPNRFLGDWMLASISKDDPAYKDQQYWRGTVWPPTNYLAYQGIKAYGFDEEAAILAQSGANLFLENWKNTGTCRENYRSDNGEGGGQRFQSWGPLFSLIVLEEFVDVDALNGGLRFGSFIRTENAVRNVEIAGHKYDVRIGSSLEVLRDGEPILKFEKPAVVRGYRMKDGVASFSVNALEDCTLTVMEKGLRQISVDGFAVAGGLPVYLSKGRHEVAAC